MLVKDNIWTKIEVWVTMFIIFIINEELLFTNKKRPIWKETQQLYNAILLSKWVIVCWPSSVNLFH